MMGFKKIITFLISLSLFNVQILPAYSSYIFSSQETVKVALIGIQFADVKQSQQDSIKKRFSSLVDSDSRLNYISETEIKDQLDPSVIKTIKENLAREDFRAAAKLLNVDYIFAGNFENSSNKKEVTALVGTMARYDVTADKLYKLNIRGFFKDFDKEIRKIDRQLVQTIIPEQNESFVKRYLPALLIAAATAVAVTLLLGGTKGQNSGSGGGPVSPLTGH